MLQDIQPDELHVKMQDPSFIEEVQLIDVREPEEVYAQLPTSILLLRATSKIHIQDFLI